MKLLNLIIIIVVALGVVFVFTNSFQTNDSTNETEQSTEVEEQIEHPLLNSTIAVPETEIKAKVDDGTGTYTDGPITGQITLGTTWAEVSGPNDNDLIYDVYVNSGGSGTFAYISLLHLSEEALLNDHDLLGDRVIVTNIEAYEVIDPSNYKIKVTYLDREEDQSFSEEPTVEITINYEVIDHKLNRL